MTRAKLALRGDVVRRSARVSALVGSVLVAINHGDHLVSGSVADDLYWKIPLTYLVPYLVSTYASVEALLRAGDAD